MRVRWGSTELVQPYCRQSNQIKFISGDNVKPTSVRRIVPDTANCRVLPPGEFNDMIL